MGTLMLHESKTGFLQQGIHFWVILKNWTLEKTENEKLWFRVNLTFIYTKVGFQDNFMYKILSASYSYESFEANKDGNSWISFSINWEEATPQETVYSAPLPKMQWFYLPDNTLYPFFMKNTPQI